VIPGPARFCGGFAIIGPGIVFEDSWRRSCGGRVTLPRADVVDEDPVRIDHRACWGQYAVKIKKNVTMGADVEGVVGTALRGGCARLPADGCWPSSGGIERYSDYDLAVKLDVFLGEIKGNGRRTSLIALIIGCAVPLLTLGTIIQVF